MPFSLNVVFTPNQNFLDASLSLYNGFFIYIQFSFNSWCLQTVLFSILGVYKTVLFSILTFLFSILGVYKQFSFQSLVSIYEVVLIILFRPSARIGHYNSFSAHQTELVLIFLFNPSAWIFFSPSAFWVLFNLTNFVVVMQYGIHEGKVS